MLRLHAYTNWGVALLTCTLCLKHLRLPMSFTTGVAAPLTSSMSTNRRSCSGNMFYVYTTGRAPAATCLICIQLAELLRQYVLCLYKWRSCSSNMFYVYTTGGAAPATCNMSYTTGGAAPATYFMSIQLAELLRQHILCLYNWRSCSGNMFYVYTTGGAAPAICFMSIQLAELLRQHILCLYN